MPGGACEQFPVAGAPCLCVGPRPDPQQHECFGAPAGDCCEDVECGGGICQAERRDHQDAYCGGAAPQPINMCSNDACLGHDDCGDGVCIPPGVFVHVRSRCAVARCLLDADCDARAGGECRPFFTRCANSGYACIYDDDPCHTDQDCPAGGIGPARCQPRLDGEGTRCVAMPPPP